MITDAEYDDGDGTIIVTGSEGLVLNDSSPVPWTVTFEGVPQPVTDVAQLVSQVVITTAAGGSTGILLSYSGGGFVTGDTTGLALEAVADFPVTII